PDLWRVGVRRVREQAEGECREEGRLGQHRPASLTWGAIAPPPLPPAYRSPRRASPPEQLLDGPDLHAAPEVGRRQSSPSRVERKPEANPPFRPGQGEPPLPRPRVPEDDLSPEGGRREVCGSRGQHPPVGAEGHGRDVPAVPRQRRRLSAP